ncbi:MAG TPA: sialate O-acetylesterase [Candidatus Paceibacterota bacterium]|nr:sialate O-acetylesterase [Candidatus Paceibacterota bacterium]
MKLNSTFPVLACAFAAAIFNVRAEVRPNSLFNHNAVLQRNLPVPVWGTAKDGEKVTVEFAGQKVSTVAANGHWRVDLKPMKASAEPRTMTIAGDNIVTLTNVVVGDVWVASGQSNMERQLGLRGGQKPIEGWEAAAAAANYPEIRQYYVPQRTALSPSADANGSWSVCTPQTAPDFTAVGFFFARDLQPAIKVPVGILFSAWGGTVAEAWTSAGTLKTMPDFKATVEAMEQVAVNPKAAEEKYRADLAQWFSANDAGDRGNWASPTLSTDGWTQADVPGAIDPNFDGLVWFRKEIELPAGWATADATLRLGNIDDADTTWVNGIQVGAMNDWLAQRDYRIPKNVLVAGRNVIVLRVLDTGGPGGFLGKPEQVRLEASGDSAPAAVSLASQWLSRKSANLWRSPAIPRLLNNDPNSPTALYNAMIAPLQSFPIKGAIWYQGEANVGRERQYQTLFPTMISDWRQCWGGGEFPFLFVQIAPFNTMSPEIREAQLLTLKASPKTAMAVTADIGDANDIHPTRKAPVGARLALAARALAYGEKLEYSGPLYDGMKVADGKVVISFTHVGSGLMAKDGELKGFTIAGVDKKFVPAKAEIKGKTVVVWSDQVAKPEAVRYGWANVPDVNLFNKEGLPASPFRTDVEK